MIRDEFKNADKEVLKKKSNVKMQEMGERAYYAKKLSLYNELIRPVSISTIFCTACFAIMAILYIVAAVLEKKVSTAMIIISSIEGLLLIWCFVWFVFLKSFVKNKSEYYKEQLTRLNKEYVKRYTK